MSLALEAKIALCFFLSNLDQLGPQVEQPGSGSVPHATCHMVTGSREQAAFPERWPKRGALQASDLQHISPTLRRVKEGQAFAKGDWREDQEISVEHIPSRNRAVVFKDKHVLGCW